MLEIQRRIRPQPWGMYCFNRVRLRILPLGIGGMYWITGHLTYSILMKPGYSYTIKVQMEKTGGDTYRGHIHAYESNREGVVTRDFYPIASHEGA